jgi:hypothetical protein
MTSLSQNPQIRPWYEKQLALLVQRHHERQLAEVAGHQIAQAQAQEGRALRPDLGPLGQQGNAGLAAGPQQMPLPNLNIPANRQRALNVGLNQQQPTQPSQQAMMAQQIAAQQQQLQAVVAQAQSQIQQQAAMPQSQSQSPGQGTPTMRANGALPQARGSTPNRVMGLQGSSGLRASPAPQGGSPNVIHGMIQNGRQGPGTTPPVLGQMPGQLPNDLQARMQGNMPQGFGASVPGQKTSGQGSVPHTPNIPHDFRPITVHSLVIPDKLADGEVKWPVASDFPNKSGERPTLSVGLGAGAVLGTPVLESRPKAFNDLLEHLNKGSPQTKNRALRGTLFDRLGPADEPEEVEEDRKILPVEKTLATVEDLVDLEPEKEAVTATTSKKRKLSEIVRHVGKDLALSEGAETVSKPCRTIRPQNAYCLRPSALNSSCSKLLTSS